MTAWSIVALAAILCLTFTICWGLWLNALYPGGEGISEPEISEDTVIYESEAETGVWPKEDEPAVQA